MRSETISIRATGEACAEGVSFSNPYVDPAAWQHSDALEDRCKSKASAWKR